VKHCENANTTENTGRAAARGMERPDVNKLVPLLLRAAGFN